MGNSRIERETSLYRTALQRGGLFRYDWAASLSRRAASYRVLQGERERVSRGIYPLAFASNSPCEDMIQTALWGIQSLGAGCFFPRNRTPHPPSFRPASQTPPSHRARTFDRSPPVGLTLHRVNLSAGNREQRSSYYVFTPLCTLLDVAQGPRISPEHLEAAVSQAIARGLVNKKGIDNSLPEVSNAASKRLNKALAAAGRNPAVSR